MTNSLIWWSIKAKQIREYLERRGIRDDPELTRAIFMKERAKFQPPKNSKFRIVKPSEIKVKGKLTPFEKMFLAKLEASLYKRKPKSEGLRGETGSIVERKETTKKKLTPFHKYLLHRFKGS